MLLSGGAALVPLQERLHAVRAYGGKEIEILGQLTVTVEDGGRKQQLQVTVTCGTSPCIYGGDWIRALHPDFAINATSELSVSLSLKAGCTPSFYVAKNVRLWP